MGTHNLAATLIAERGVVLFADLTAAVPTYAQMKTYIDAGADSASLPVGWAPLGETDPEDLPKWDSEGGKETVKRTWRLLKARVTKEPEAKSFLVKPLQFDGATMSLYEGGGDNTKANEFTAPSAPVPVEKSGLVIYLDGSNPVGEYMGRLSIASGGSIEHGIDEWSRIPLKCTVLTPTDSAKPEHRWLGRWFGTNA